jgi:hypothetical protein
MQQIELTNKDCVLFLKFRENQSNFEKMLEMGVFEKDNISVTVYFDKFSSIRAVDKTKRITCNYKKVLQFV